LLLQNSITVVDATATVPDFVNRKCAQSLIDPVRLLLQDGVNQVYPHSRARTAVTDVVPPPRALSQDIEVRTVDLHNTKQRVEILSTI
jgi:hypothetical protein